jgi:DNA-binding CsgD family transcriptional regulator
VPLVGRALETAVVDRLLSSARDGRGSALVVRGEAGVGKSALLAYARGVAADFLVLHAVGIESEAELAFAGLHQLLHPLLDRIAALPPPQSAALRAAFALSDETVAERFRISLGVLSLLAAAAEERPVLCVVDDAQWLDQPSAVALLFAARRLEAERVAILFGARTDPAHEFVATAVNDIRLATLPDAEARTLAGRELGESAAGEAVDWVVANAKGNPLALVELPQALTPAQARGAEPLAGLAAPATSVERTYLDRVARLPAPVRSLLLVVAAEDTGDRTTISHAADRLGLEGAGFAAADAQGLVDVEFDRITFRHPLIRSAVYRSADVHDRERAHRALADVLDGPAYADRRAWHRAAATAGTDDDVADELESTADRAHSRAGYSGAATALERAAALSTDVAERERRLVRAARSAWQAGEPERALALVDAIPPTVRDPDLCAEREHIRGLVEMGCGALLTAGTILLTGADGVAAHDPRKALEMLLDAGSTAGRSGNFVQMAEVGRRAAQLPATDDAKDDVLRNLLIGVGGVIEGRTTDEAPRIRAAISRAEVFDDPRVLSWAAVGAATIGEPGVEATILSRALAAARASGSVDALVLMLEASVASAHVSGRYALAAEAEEGLRLAREVGLSNAGTAFVASLCWVAGLEGREAACHAGAAEVAAAARAGGMANSHSIAQWAVALLDLAHGAADRTAARLAALHAAPPGEAHPFYLVMSTPDLVEAYLLTGQRGRAREAFGRLEAFARPGAPAWALALAARCRALLSDGDRAEADFQVALRHVSAVGRPFDRARTQLTCGQFLRRQRRRSDAREHLRAALGGFERLGAEPWAERARIELRATGETARKRDPSTLTQLTPQEMQIARLVGEGSSNKDVATQLFLSPRTVEYHLAKVFAKLGISSRADLIRQAAILEPAG